VSETLQNLGVNNWTVPLAPLAPATTSNPNAPSEAIATNPVAGAELRSAIVHPHHLVDLNRVSNQRGGELTGGAKIGAAAAAFTMIAASAGSRNPSASAARAATRTRFT
jgi:hypothetical protein